MPAEEDYSGAGKGMSRVWRAARSTGKWILLVAGILAVAVTLPAAAYDVYGSVKLRAARRAAAAKGLVLSYDSWLQNQPGVPDTFNAALYYEAAFSLMRVRGLPTWFEEVFPETYRTVRTETKAARTMQVVLRDPRQALPDDVYAEVKALVGNRGDVIRAVHDGAALSRSRYQVDWDIRNKPMPYFEPMRTTIPLLMLGAWVDAEEKRVPEAIEKIKDALALARSFSGQPSVRLAVRENEGVSNALHAGLARVLARAEVPNESLLALQECVQRYDAEYPEMRALEGILALDCDLRLALWEGRKSLQEEGANVVPAFFLRGYLKTDEALLINYFLKAFGSHMPAERPPRFYVQAYARSIHLENMRNEIEATQATLRCAAVALAAARYRNDKGKWPETLTALYPDYIAALFEDPFARGPVSYVPGEGSIMVYSVGPNRKDDGGRPDLVRGDPNDNTGADYTDDVGVRLWEYAQK